LKGIVMSASPWTDEEITILEEHYPERGASLAGQLLNRSTKAVQIKACRLGILCDTFVREGRPLWTEQEIGILQKYYPVEGAAMAERVPDRTINAVRRKAAVSGLAYVYKCEHIWHNGIEGKICTGCQIWKPLSQFFCDRQRRDELTTKCKKCMSEYYYAHQDRYTTLRHKSRRENPAQYKEQVKKYAQSPRGRAVRQLTLAKRRLMENTGDLTLAQWEEIIDQHTRCPYCGHPFDNDTHKLTMDHMIPLGRDGEHSQDNVLPVCFRCNRAKGSKILGDEWLPWELYDEQG